MKMQEAITKLQKLAPVAADNTSFAESLMCELVGVMEDMANAASLTALKAIAAEALKLAKTVQDHIVIATKSVKIATKSVEELQDINASYKERLGSRTRKQKDPADMQKKKEPVK